MVAGLLKLSSNFDIILPLWTVGRCQFQVPWGLQLFGGTLVAQLRNPATGVAQAELHKPRSYAIYQKQLRKQSCAILEVGQAELRHPWSCASKVSQS